MNRLATGVAQCLRQGWRKLSVDKKKQSLFRRDDGMIGLTGSKRQNCINVRTLKIGIFLKDRLP